MELQRITLKGGAEVLVDFDNKGKCKKCGKHVVWANTVATGKYMPIVMDQNREWMSHFVDCPFSKQFRHRKQREEDLLSAVEMQRRRDLW